MREPLAQAEPLARHPLLRSSDPAEVDALYRRKQMRFEPLGGEVRVTVNTAYLPAVHVSYLAYGAAARVRLGAARDEHWLALPVSGGLQATAGGVSHDCRPGGGLIASPGRDMEFRSEAGGERYGLAIGGEALIGQLAALLGAAPDRPLVFAPALDGSRGGGRVVTEHLKLAVRELEAGDSLLRNPLMAAQFGQSVMTALLLAQPHSHSAALSRREGAPAPRDVKRAVDYIHAHLDQPIALADLVAVSGVPGRTLYKHFQDFKGVSPLSYLRQARLLRAREELLQGAPGASVACVAGRWGFEHLGRFAGAYRRRFGETPSETLRRSR